MTVRGKLGWLAVACVAAAALGGVALTFGLGFRPDLGLWLIVAWVLLFHAVDGCGRLLGRLWRARDRILR